MGKLQKNIKKAGLLWELPANNKDNTVFGEKGGVGVQMLAGKNKNNNETFIGVVKWGNQDKDDTVRRYLSESSTLLRTGIKMKEIEVKDGAVVYTKPITVSFSPPSSKQMVQRMQTLVDEVTSAVGTIAPDCRTCGAKNTEPVLINGIVDRICSACIEKVRIEAQNLAAAYEAIPVRWIRALATASILALIGAIVWDAVIIFTHTMFWLLAIGIGVVIGWATTKAAGKGDLSIQVVSGFFTVLSVVGGMTVLYVLAALGQAMENNSFNASLFQEIFFGSLKESIGDIVFATAGGLIGAAVAAQRAGRPSFDISVES